MVTIEKAIATVIASQAEAIIKDCEDTSMWVVCSDIKYFRDQWEIAIEGRLDDFISTIKSCTLKKSLEALDKTIDELKEIAQSARDGSMNPSLLRLAFGRIVFQCANYEDAIEDVAKIMLVDSMSENERLEFIDDERDAQICQ